MIIPNNSLAEKIKEIVHLCEQISHDYGEEASWFMQPTSSKEISSWENEHNICIPDTYKEWLDFTNEAQIRNTLAHFYGPSKFILNPVDLPTDMVIVADLVGDGEQLCFSKTTRNFFWADHGELEEFSDFGAVLTEIIRMLKPQSNLSSKMEDLLMKMVNEEKNVNKKE